MGSRGGSGNGVCHNPAGGVLGSDQRMQFAAFEGIKETTPAGKQTKVQNLGWLEVKKYSRTVVRGTIKKVLFSDALRQDLWQCNVRGRNPSLTCLQRQNGLDPELGQSDRRNHQKDKNRTGRVSCLPVQPNFDHGREA